MIIHHYIYNEENVKHLFISSNIGMKAQEIQITEEKYYNIIKLQDIDFCHR